MTTTLIALIANAAPADQAITTACSYLFRSLGAVTGLSIVSAIMQQQLRNRLHDILGSGRKAEDIVLRVRESLEYIRQLDPATATIVRTAYSDSVRTAFNAIIVFFIAAWISSCKFRARCTSSLLTI